MENVSDAFSYIKNNTYQKVADDKGNAFSLGFGFLPVLDLSPYPNNTSTEKPPCLMQKRLKQHLKIIITKYQF
jgi:hypothetical protein